MNDNANQNSEVEQEILRLEEELRQAEMRLDIPTLDQTYADDIMVTAPVGIVCDKSAVLTELHQAADKGKVESLDKDNIKVRAYGDTAVTSYRMTVKGRYEDTEVNRQFQITNVWMKRQGHWQIVARHTAHIEQPKTEQASA